MQVYNIEEEKAFRFFIRHNGEPEFWLEVDTYGELLDDLAQIFRGVSAEEFEIFWVGRWVNLSAWCDQRELTYPLRMCA